MKSTKPLFFSILFLVLFTFKGQAQGELLNIDQSGLAGFFQTAKIEDVRSSAFGFSYTIKRKFELGVSKFSSSDKRADSRGVTTYAAFFLNSDSWMQMKGSVGLSFADGDKNTLISATLYANNSKNDYKVVPTVSLIFLSGEIAFGGGLNFKMGNSLSLIGGIDVIKYMNADLTIGLSVGFILSDNPMTVPKE